MRLDVVCRSHLLGRLGRGDGRIDSSLLQKRIPEQPGEGGERVAFSDRLEHVIVTAKLTLGRDGVARQQLDPGRVERTVAAITGPPSASSISRARK